MKKTVSLLVLVLMCGFTAFAQDVPKAELFLGYNFVRINSTSTISAYSTNGGSGQIAYNVGRWVSAVADFGGYHNGVINGKHIDNTIVSYLFGPRLNLRTGKLNPYVNILFGGIWAGASTALQTCTGTSCTSAGQLAGSQNAFAMAVGGGLDYKINKHVAFRPIGLDYFLTRLHNPLDASDHNQHNLRYSAGINFYFGGQ